MCLLVAEQPAQVSACQPVDVRMPAKRTAQDPHPYPHPQQPVLCSKVLLWQKHAGLLASRLPAPTNRNRTSDLEMSMERVLRTLNRYSLPLYQLSYGRSHLNSRRLHATAVAGRAMDRRSRQNFSLRALHLRGPGRPLPGLYLLYSVLFVMPQPRAGPHPPL